VISVEFTRQAGDLPALSKGIVMHIRRKLHVVGACVALTAGALALVPGTADAATCDGTAVADCTMTGTVTLTPSTLSIVSPTSLAWGATLTGVSQDAVDTTGADQQYTVDDSTGSTDGWNVTVSATTFTNGASTFADDAFFTNGSVTDPTNADAPTAACSDTTCTLPTNATAPITYPVTITTADVDPTPVKIYSADAGSGIGSILIGGDTAANPVGWWVTVPGSAMTGDYTSLITIAVATGP
jgi:hypothetical protein